MPKRQTGQLSLNNLEGLRILLFVINGQGKRIPRAQVKFAHVNRLRRVRCVYAQGLGAIEQFALAFVYNLGSISINLLTSLYYL